MAAISGQNKIVQEFIKALGIDPKETQEVHLHIVYDKLVTVEVVKIVMADKLSDLIKSLKTYELHLKDKEE